MDSRRISGILRTLLTLLGVGLAGVGVYATLATANGAGAAALTGVGVALLVLAMIGRWPSRISVGGNELSWEKVRATVQSQIERAREADEPAAVVAELQALERRIDELRLTGAVAEHPAETYDRAVEAALRRIVPDAEITRSRSPRYEIPDFTVRGDGWTLALETKWRSDPAASYRGTTLAPLVEALPDGAPVVVVVRGTEAAVRPARSAKSVVGAKARVVAWRDQADDARLAEAIAALVGTAPAGG